MPNYPYPQVPRFETDALGIHTSYYEMGVRNGRPIILLHGMSTSADSFRETMHELADDHWLIAPDIPGFGYTASTTPYNFPHLVEWLAAFCEVLHLPPVSLLGHSFGGTLAVTYAVDYPEQVEKLLLMAPAVLSSGSYPEFVKRIGVGLGLIDLGSAVSQSKLWVRRQIKTPFYNPELIDESVWDRRLADYELARQSADVLKASAFHDLRPSLSNLHHEICMVWGENDGVVPPSDADVLAEQFPNSQTHILPECGHAPMLEKQVEVQGIARQFLK
ncbi:alpha/beta fold hydrolase [Candidatus Leptofilum sp.]|uniref:alpha/beta fold hydrolase n=1 Tax=Candidatus Leptofilum sp. TaxID=3241576 RepID=UPI003B5A9BD2